MEKHEPTPDAQTGKVFRFAPSRGGVQAAETWRVGNKGTSSTSLYEASRTRPRSASTEMVGGN